MDEKQKNTASDVGCLAALAIFALLLLVAVYFLLDRNFGLLLIYLAMIAGVGGLFAGEEQASSRILKSIFSVLSKVLLGAFLVTTLSILAYNFGELTVSGTAVDSATIAFSWGAMTGGLLGLVMPLLNKAFGWVR